jgi:hypothetical protein
MPFVSPTAWFRTLEIVENDSLKAPGLCLGQAAVSTSLPRGNGINGLQCDLFRNNGFLSVMNEHQGAWRMHNGIERI